TFRQSRIWHDSESLWQHTIALAPNSPIACENLANVRMEQGQAAFDPGVRRARYEKADTLLNHGLAIASKPGLLFGLATVHCWLADEQPERRGEHLAVALDAAQRGMASLPADEAKVEWRLNYGTILLKLGR